MSVEDHRKEFLAKQGIIRHLGDYIAEALNPRFKATIVPGHKPGHWRMVVGLHVGEGQVLLSDIVDVAKEACCPSECNDDFGIDDQWIKATITREMQKDVK